MTELLQEPETLRQPSLDELVRFAGEAGCYSDEAPRQLHGGHHNDTFRYGDVVIKYPKARGGDEALCAEFDFLRELDGRRMPRAIARGEIAGTPVALLEFIPGGHEDFNELDSEQVKELASAMFELHSITSSRFSGISGTAPAHEGTHADYLWAMVHESVTSRLDGRDLSAYEGAKETIQKGLEKLEEILAAHPDDFAGRTFSLLHHDLNPQNVRWTPEGRVVFIDPNPTYGDPLDDVNYAITNNQGSAEFQRMLLAAYAGLLGQEKISSVRMAAYTLKNWLDDLAWTIEMQENHPGNAGYVAAYARRLAALDELLRA